jgi:hypothetical protein
MCQHTGMAPRVLPALLLLAACGPLPGDGGSPRWLAVDTPLPSPASDMAIGDDGVVWVAFEGEGVVRAYKLVSSGAAVESARLDGPVAPQALLMVAGKLVVVERGDTRLVVMGTDGAVSERIELGTAPVAIAAGKDNLGILLGSGSTATVVSLGLLTFPASARGKLVVEDATDVAADAAGDLLITREGRNDLVWVSGDGAALFLKATDPTCSAPHAPFIARDSGEAYVACTEGLTPATPDGQPAIHPFTGKVSAIAATDLDLVALDRATSSLVTWKRGVVSTTDGPVTGGLAGNPLAIGHQDVNRDGLADLVVLGQDTLEVLIDSKPSR